MVVVIRPHCSTMYVDAAYCYRQSSVVCGLMHVVECLQSSSVHQSPAFAARRHKVRTSLDLELDLQAYNIQHAQVTEDIATLRQIKRQLEDAKAQGNAQWSATSLDQNAVDTEVVVWWWQT